MPRNDALGTPFWWFDWTLSICHCRVPGEEIDEVRHVDSSEVWHRIRFFPYLKFICRIKNRVKDCRNVLFPTCWLLWAVLSIVALFNVQRTLSQALKARKRWCLVCCTLLDGLTPRSLHVEYHLSVLIIRRASQLLWKNTPVLARCLCIGRSKWSRFDHRNHLQSSPSQQSHESLSPFSSYLSIVSIVINYTLTFMTLSSYRSSQFHIPMHFWPSSFAITLNHCNQINQHLYQPIHVLISIFIATRSTYHKSHISYIDLHLSESFNQINHFQSLSITGIITTFIIISVYHSQSHHDLINLSYESVSYFDPTVYSFFYDC